MLAAKRPFVPRGDPRSPSSITDAFWVWWGRAVWTPCLRRSVALTTELVFPGECEGGGASLGRLDRGQFGPQSVWTAVSLDRGQFGP